MYLNIYLEFLRRAEQALGRSYRLISDGHPDDADVHYTTARFADSCATRADLLTPVLTGGKPASLPEPERLHIHPLTGSRPGPVGLLRDLQDLHQIASLVDITWTLVNQAGHGARNQDLLHVVEQCAPEATAQVGWLVMRMKAAAPQTLLVAT